MPSSRSGSVRCAPSTGATGPTGRRRVTAELNDGVPAADRLSHKWVARVMAGAKIAGIRPRRRVRTTVPEPSDQLVPDLLERDFTADEPNRIYVGDITYLPCGDGQSLYLATVIDCFSRRLVGWSIADHIRTELVTDALTAAAATRGSLAGAIFHSDHGAQGAVRYAQRLAEAGAVASVGSTSDSYALAEAIDLSDPSSSSCGCRSRGRGSRRTTCTGRAGGRPRPRFRR
jgi:transposase InsO family protein